MIKVLKNKSSYKQNNYPNELANLLDLEFLKL